MISCDALIVGGGPGGSTCARMLHRAGWNVVVLDRARFPRDKVCAGWVTPEAFALLDLRPDDYGATGLTIQEISGFRTGVLGRRLVDTRYPRVVSYAIRRCEFDHFLLRRAGARVIEGTPAAEFVWNESRWIVNGNISASVVIGAGGHFCPVARYMRGGVNGPSPVVAKEAEFPLPRAEDSIDGQMPELFFCRDLEGYGWCVRKGDYLNIGIGRRTSHEFTSHVRNFTEFLQERYRLPEAASVRWRGHAYLAAGTGAQPLIDHGMLVIGDAAGLAYPESGEGIRPAIESGRLAAETLISAGGRIDVDALRPYADAMRRLHPASRRLPTGLRAVSAALGRALLASPTFTRSVVLDRWFLRGDGAGRLP